MEEGSESNIKINNDESSSHDLQAQACEQLEELDDDEFQLPCVSELPTLESILDEEDQGSVSDAEFDLLPSTTNHLKAPIFSDAAETASVHSRSSDNRSRTSSEKIRKRKKESCRRAYGSILRHVVLKGVSTQLLQATERVDAGLPTTMDVGNVICVGMSHALVMVFEHSQALKWCLGSTDQRELYGGVSALSINQDSSKLLIGYSKGHVCLYDLNSGKLLQNMPDVHTPFTAVLHIKWTDCPGLVLLSDSGGSVYEFSIKRLMGRNANESRCIFSGSRGEVCTIEPLNMGQLLTLPPVVDTVIVAMATISKVLVMSLRPHLKVHFSRSLPSSKNLPLIAWQFVIIQIANGSKVVDPVLAFGRDNVLYFYQLTHGLRDDLTFIFLQEIHMSYTLQSIAWLNSRSLAVIDTNERLHVIDVKSKHELDCVDLVKLALVYATSDFKGLSTGGNVSKAMAAYGERACYHSMKTLGPQVLLLGTKSFHVVTIRSWVDRLNHLVDNGHRKESLQVSLDMLHNKAVGVSGLPHNKEKRKRLITEKLYGILVDYLEDVQGQATSIDNPTKLINYYEQEVAFCVKVAIEADLIDALFSTVWQYFSSDPISKGIFLESLEPYILDDHIQTIPPYITQCLLSHYENKQKYEAIEACIVHLSIDCLDLHQTMTLCWANGLYDAIFYVHTQGMLDYVTPFNELIVVLKNALDSNSLNSSQVSLGNKILVYISSCLAGRAYPRGNIQVDQIKQVKHEIFKCITTLHSKYSQHEKSYPYLRTLLQFDTREFLNVLSLAFEEEEFCTELGIVQRHRVIDILLQIMTEDDEFSATQVVALFTFIARQIVKQHGTLQFSQELCGQVVENLTSPECDSHHEERESALLDLLLEGKVQQLDTESLLQRAEAAKFYRVCEYIYESTGRHGHILSCYIMDKLRKHHTFSYMRTVLNSNHYEECHKHLIKQQIVNQVEDLLQIDATQLASLLLEVPILNPLIPQIADTIQSDNLLYEYLSALFACRASVTPRAISNNAYDDLLYPTLEEEFIRLMAALEPDRVYRYLRDISGYRIEETLDICRQHELHEAIGYLMEEKGDLRAAFEIYMKVLENKVKHVFESTDSDDKATISLGFGQIVLQVNRLVRVCEQWSKNASEENRKSMWLPLLHLVLSINGDANVDINCLIGGVVNAMMSYVSLPVILERIVEDRTYSDCTYGQIKQLLQDMLQRYSYENTLYKIVVKIVQKDQLKYLALTRKQKMSPITMASTKCYFCHHSSSQLIAFHCGHLYHMECGGDGDDCAICWPSERNEIIVPNNSVLTNAQLEGLSKMTVLDNPIPRWSHSHRYLHANTTFYSNTADKKLPDKKMPKTVEDY